MTSPKHSQKGNYSPEAVALADAILKASGSNLKNYTMQSSRDAILGAAQSALNSARSEMVDALQKADEEIEKLLDDDTNEITSWVGGELKAIQAILTEGIAKAGAG